MHVLGEVFGALGAFFGSFFRHWFLYKVVFFFVNFGGVLERVLEAHKAFKIEILDFFGYAFQDLIFS